MKSSTIVLWRHDYADIPWIDAFTAPIVHAVDGHGGGLLFATAEANHPGIHFLGFGRNFNPDYRSIFCNLDQAWQPVFPISTVAQLRGFKDAAHPGWGPI